ncbi:carboxymuconolactone decarboxylase family protein [Desertimonas flava]|uniref:carboxymuconolactone decarboxylase family protein n=1 Tax=Desertimonas flava TaxID=2064846 RepID=UPI0023F173C7|nr:carboxymuconolactone decarboxylase family protein [Desertimonas flava]
MASASSASSASSGRPAPPPWPAARLTLLAPDQLDAPARRLHDAIAGGCRAGVGTVPIVDDAGRLLGPFRVMLASPEVGDAVQALGVALRFGTSLDARRRELVVMTVAGELGSAFEWWAHERAAIAEGIADDVLDDLLSGRRPAALDAFDQELVALARVLTRERRLDDARFHAALTLLGEEGLAELTWLVGYYSMLALALEVFAPENPLVDGVSRSDRARLAR